VDPRVSKKKIALVTLSSQMIAADLLTRLSQENSLDWEVMGTAIHISRPEDIAKIREQKKKSAEILANTAQENEKNFVKNIDLKPGSYSMAKLLSVLKTMEIELIVGSEVVEQNYFYTTKKSPVTLKNLLEQIAEATQAGYVMLDGTIYLVQAQKAF
jgi:hypothetical protein